MLQEKVEALGASNVSINNSLIGPWVEFTYNGQLFRAGFIGGAFADAFETIASIIRDNDHPVNVPAAEAIGR